MPPMCDFQWESEKRVCLVKCEEYKTSRKPSALQTSPIMPNTKCTERIQLEALRYFGANATKKNQTEAMGMTE